ncbi:hypothetical protein BC828DRAFT_221314 [Blastocladiella britannica]|nr:hypothetical protein BC828DRAFT_221314 [Blastocladiella britannica]
MHCSLLHHGPKTWRSASQYAVNFVLIESLFTDSLKREVEERQIDVLSKLTRVYSSALMPQEHVSPIGRMLVTVIERLDETGSPGFAQVIEKLVAACIHHFSQLNPEQMQIEGMIAVLLSQNLSPSCKKMIIKSVAAHDLETHFSILVYVISLFPPILANV